MVLMLTVYHKKETITHYYQEYDKDWALFLQQLHEYYYGNVAIITYYSADYYRTGK